MMNLTIRELSEAAGVSIRSLHFYEELGLLLPLYRGKGGTRFYGEPQLLQLQQILLYKELGLSLKTIQKLMSGTTSTHIAVLTQQLDRLVEERSRLDAMIHSVDRTIQHIRSHKTMKPQDYFQGLSETAIDHNNPAEAAVLNAVAAHGQTQAKPITAHRRQELLAQGAPIYLELAKCLAAKLPCSSPAVQLLIAQHFELAATTQGRSLEAYSALAELYVSHGAFRAQLATIAPELPEFVAGAMQAFCLNTPRH